MNERIRELAEQADWWKPLGLPSDWNEGDYVVSSEQMEKYAELIVRECIQVCNSRVGNSDYNTGRMHCVSDLKEHFGVEE